MNFSWEVSESDGLVAAKGSCPDLETAVRECGHYFTQYRQDSPAKGVIREGRKIVWSIQ